MLTDIELLNHIIDTHKKSSQSLKDKHEWGNWNNWRTFTRLDIEIIELEIELLLKEKEHLLQALNDYKDY